MEIRHLLYFKTLAEVLHFGKAAEKLCISQPPLSRQIKELETELGAVLFLRNNKMVRLTDAGLYFLTQVDELIHKLEHARNTVRKIHEHVSGDFRLGYVTSTSKLLLAGVLKKISLEYPYLRVLLYETSTQKQKIALENGNLDLGIVRMPLYSPQLTTEELFRDKLCIIGPPSVVLEKELFRRANFISFNQRYAPEYQQLVVNACNRIGFEPHVVHQCNTMQSILELVYHGLGLAVVPQSFVREKAHMEFSIYKIDKRLATTETALAYPTDNRLPVLQNMITLIKKELGEA